jgi:glyoxylase-like metal-dependent hydrolase (beta-lactamase superfamily II)
MGIKFTLLDAGYCTHPEHIVLKGGRSVNCRFPAAFALIEHPQLGCILFDTGYAAYFYAEAKTFPGNIYSLVTPVYLKSEETAAFKLKQRGILAEDVNYVVISHFHADHIAGLRDFPNAIFLYFSSCFRVVKNTSGFAALRKGFLKGLLPDQLENRSRYLEDFPTIDISQKFAPFTQGYALSSDLALIAVELPGHATGQAGLIVQVDQQTIFFLVADACWLTESYKQLKPPHPITNLIFSDARAYQDTLQKLHDFNEQNPLIEIIPSHCPVVLKKMGGRTYESIS